MAWGSKITATQLTGITTEQVFDQAPTLNPRESAHCRVAVDFPASPTDDAVISVWDGQEIRAVRRWSAHQHHRRGRHRQLVGYQFTGEALDEAYVPFFGVFGAAWDDAMVACWSANPLGLLVPEMDAAFPGSGGGEPPSAAQRPVVIIAAGWGRISGLKILPMPPLPGSRSPSPARGS
jgi:hypothetical protein